MYSALHVIKMVSKNILVFHPNLSFLTSLSSDFYILSSQDYQYILAVHKANQ